MGNHATIHVYYGPEHEIAAFCDQHLQDGDALLTYRDRSTTGVREHGGSLISDGWVLSYPDGDEDIIGVWDISQANEAYAKAQEYFARWRTDQAEDSARSAGKLIDIREYRKPRE